MFDGGRVKIYQLSNISEPGDMPTEGVFVLFAEFDFEERSIGMTRNYMAKQNNEQIDRLIRIWQDRYILPDFVCKIDDGIDSAVQYRIARVEHVIDGDGLKVTDLTLEKVGTLYDVE